MGANGAVTIGKVWGYGQDRPYYLLGAALRAVRREGIAVTDLPAANGSAAGWAKAVARCVADGTCRGGVVFCDDPGLICCVANKVTGLRAVPVVTVAQAARATLTLGANLLAVEMPGRTYFEMRQIIRILCCGDGPSCPEVVAGLLREMDGHAHR
jgi:ribose 5-phosphate isomerase RpiB